MNLIIRNIREDDCQIISDAFQVQRWHKPVELYQQYANEFKLGLRDVLMAEINGEFTGYVTILWQSDYLPFKQHDIPEIVDLNVLIRFRNQGIASSLLQEAEKRISFVSPVAGIGVGLMHDYGNAQKLYVKCGYIPDGKGIWTHGRHLSYGDTVILDDDVALYFVKQL
jgi:ribosomal protein S18 acetylase RimI-like enzyme